MGIWAAGWNLSKLSQPILRLETNYPQVRLRESD